MHSDGDLSFTVLLLKVWKMMVISIEGLLASTAEFIAQLVMLPCRRGFSALQERRDMGSYV